MRSLLLVFWLVLLPLRGAFAQAGVQVGSAAAAFGTGVSRARDADAVLWNPALVGVQPYDDVRSAPEGGLRLLSISVGSAASRTWLEGAGRYGLLGRGVHDGLPMWARFVSPGGAGGQGGSGDVVWVGSATGTVGLALATHAEAGGPMERATAGDSLHRALSSALSLGFAESAGTVLGIRTRAGVTLKARWVHVNGAGAWQDPASAGALLREMVVRGVPGGSVDVGVVLQPGPVVVSAVVSDALRLTARPRGGARVRTVVRGPSGELVDIESPAVDASDSQEDRDAADAVYRASVPPTVARVGLSWSQGWGVTAVSVEHRLRVGGLQEVAPTVWSASLDLPGAALPLRLGVSGGSGTSGVGLGWISRSCRFPWSASVGRTRRVPDGSRSLSFSVSYGIRSARACDGSF